MKANIFLVLLLFLYQTLTPLDCFAGAGAQGALYDQMTRGASENDQYDNSGGRGRQSEWGIISRLVVFIFAGVPVIILALYLGLSVGIEGFLWSGVVFLVAAGTNNSFLYWISFFVFIGFMYAGFAGRNNNFPDWFEKKEPSDNEAD